MKEQTNVLVTGAGGFIGHHLVKRLKAEGYYVRGVDTKKPIFEASEADEFLLLDLRRWENCLRATEGMTEVYALAADMGGMGFISENNSRILHNNILINTHTLEATRQNGGNRLLFASSACVYPEYRQMTTEQISLKESDAYPAQPQDAYGWEKLVTERLALHYEEDFGLQTRIARFHNIFGPLGTWEGGREKVPAAMCRKIAYAKMTGHHEVEIWGDGKQKRSFCYIDDCIDGIRRLMVSDYNQPMNIGSDYDVTVNELVEMITEIAGITVQHKHISGPMGVRGRNSDNTQVRQILDWEPSISLQEGLQKTYQWIEQQVYQNKEALDPA